MCKRGTTTPSNVSMGSYAARYSPEACAPHLLGAGGRPYEVCVRAIADSALQRLLPPLLEDCKGAVPDLGYADDFVLLARTAVGQEPL